MGNQRLDRVPEIGWMWFLISWGVIASAATFWALVLVVIIRLLVTGSGN